MTFIGWIVLAVGFGVVLIEIFGGNKEDAS